MDDSFSLLQPDQVVIDLGCFPGGWSEVAVERCLASSTTSRVIGVDKVRMDPLSHHTFVQGDVGDQALLDRLVSELGERRADLVLSDLAPQLVGLKLEDHLASMQLALHASRIMEHVLRIGGVFLLKSLYGCENQNLRMYLDTRFQTVRTIRPPASRGTFREMFHICVGFVGRPSISEEVQTRSSFSDKFEGLDLFAYRPGDRR